MAPSCALDDAGLRRQLERYRQVGESASLVDQARRRLVIALDANVDSELVEEAITVERGCCPFFELRWEPESRRLTVAVSQAAHEPALDAIAYALDL